MNKNLKILSISHTDMDGAGCTIVLKNVFDNVINLHVGYNNLDVDLMNAISNHEYDMIFTTDINLRKEHINILKTAKKPFVHIDHHDDKDGIHNGKNIIVDNTYCGAKLTKEFLEKTLGVDLSHLNELVDTIDDYDRWQDKKPLSKPLNYLFGMYGMAQFIYRFKDGFVPQEITEPEKSYITKKIKNLKTSFETIKKTMIQSPNSNIAIIFPELKTCSEMCDRTMKAGYANVVFYIDLKTFACGARTILDDLNLGKVLSKIGIGGGHPMAAGFDFKAITQNDLFDDNTKLDKILAQFEHLEKVLVKINDKVKK